MPSAKQRIMHSTPVLRVKGQFVRFEVICEGAVFIPLAVDACRNALLAIAIGMRCLFFSLRCSLLKFRDLNSSAKVIVLVLRPTRTILWSGWVVYGAQAQVVRVVCLREAAGRVLVDSSRLRSRV